MIVVGEGVFRGCIKRKSGEFINKEGHRVEYDEKYILKIDAVSENGEISEGTFLIEKEQKELIEKLLTIKLYSNVNVKFFVRFSAKEKELAYLKVLDVYVENDKEDAKQEDEEKIDS